MFSDISDIGCVICSARVVLCRNARSLFTAPAVQPVFFFSRLVFFFVFDNLSNSGY